MARKRLVWLLAIAVLLVLLAGDVIATRHYLTAPHPGHNDFMSRWEGARSYWRDGLDPYGDQASLNIQQRIYGRAAHDDEDPGYFAYPFYAVFYVWPLIYLSYDWASALWMVLEECWLIGAAVLLLDLFRIRLKGWLLGVVLLWTLLYYYAARGLLLGQPGILVYFLEVLTIWALAKRRERLAGVSLALSLVKPQMGFLLVPFLLLAGLRFGWKRFLISFAAVTLLMVAASFLLEPGWLGGWLDQLGRYTSYTALGAPVWIIVQYYLGLGSAVEWAVNLLLGLGLLWTWYAVLVRGEVEKLDWTLMLTLTITHLVAIRTATPHYILFNLPLFFYVAWLLEPGRRAGSLGVALLFLALLLIPWIHFLVTVEGEFEHPTVYLPLPLLMLAVLWATRRVWWQARPMLPLP